MRLPLLLLALIPTADDHPAEAVGTLAFDRGEDLGFVIPASEQLDYHVILDIAVVGETGVGTFTLSAGTEEHRAGLAANEPGKSSGKLIGWIRGQAHGHALNYTLEHSIETRILPQAWPHVIYRDFQTGSENRKREIMYGTRGGKTMSWFRRDGHCLGCDRPEHMLEGTWPFSSDHHCRKCKRGEHRHWFPPTTQEVPENAVDMLCAIHLARSMVQDGRESMSFPMLDKDTYWDVTLTRARTQHVPTPAGTFRCVEIKFDPAMATEKKEGRFRGLFGIHGSLSIWLEAETGVPVSIEGDVPAGPLTIGVSLRLSGHRGVPAGFAPVE